jgi:hypothetical protein
LSIHIPILSPVYSLPPVPFFHSFLLQVTSVLVVNNALQGILSSFFFKFADTILKKYSSTIATIFTGLMSAALFGHALTLNFCIGVSIVFISMHLFFSLGGIKGRGTDVTAKMTLSPSLDHVAMTKLHSAQGDFTGARDRDTSAGVLGGGSSSMHTRDVVARMQHQLPR